MAELILDGQKLESMEDILALFARTLALPEYWGRNLDALFDCLTDCPENVRISLLHWEEMEARLGRRGRALTSLLRRAAEENPHITLSEEQ